VAWLLYAFDLVAVPDQNPHILAHRFHSLKTKNERVTINQEKAGHGPCQGMLHFEVRAFAGIPFHLTEN
jgi:hypothetical protein